MSDSFKPEECYDKLMSSLNPLGRPQFSTNNSECHVQIFKDSNIAPGKFMPHPLAPGSYKAHPITIRALRKDIFVAGENLFEDLEQLHTCTSCAKELDLQFWHFCPYCEATFKKNP